MPKNRKKLPPINRKKCNFQKIGSLKPKGQKVCSVARDRRTDRHTRKCLLWAPFQGFMSFSFNLSRIGSIYFLQKSHKDKNVIERCREY